MRTRSIAALVFAAAMVLGLSACGGGGSSGDGSSNGITIFNSKMEIQSQMEEMAKKYSEEKGVNVEVYYCMTAFSKAWKRRGEEER